jgi:hypothetical protein
MQEDSANRAERIIAEMNALRDALFEVGAGFLKKQNGEFYPFA